MKVLLVAVNSKYIHTSLAVRALTAYADSPDVSYIEFTINERIEDVISRIYSAEAETVMFSCYIWNIEFILKTASTLKKLNPSVNIILGGPEVTFDSVEYMNNYPFIDGIMCGEGEQILADFLSNGIKVNGMVYRDGQNIIIMPKRDSVCDMDLLPFPYTCEDIEANKNKLIYYETSRGCPYKCSYCLSSTAHNVRFRSVERVKKDLLEFINGGVRIVKFVDRTFNADKKRAVEIVRFLIENGKDTQFHFEIAADILSDEIIDLFKTSPKGMFLLEIGVQSTNEKTIEAIDRKTDFGKIKKAVKELNGFVHMHFDLIAGLPYETYEDFKKSFNDVMELEPDVLQLGFLKLLRGTKIRTESEKHSYIFNDHTPYEVLANKYISYEEIQKLKAVENVLERYYNSGVFKNSIGYLLNKYTSPFELFSSLGEYFSQKGYLNSSLSQNSLYAVLAEFNCEELFREYLKLDFFLNTNNPSTPSWAVMPYDKALLKQRFEILSEEFINKNLPEYKDTPVKEIIKSLQFERFYYDVLGNGGKEDNIILFDKKYQRCVKC